MLSASGLLYSWRSRAGRSHPDPDPPIDPLSADPTTDGDPHPRYPRRHPRRRRRLGDGPQLEPRRAPPAHLSTELNWLANQGDGDATIGSSIYGASAGSTVDRLRLTRNDQLPGAVLQARARLQERLRGISPSGNSQTSLNSEMTRNEVAIIDEMRLMNLGEPQAESPVEWSESGSLQSNLRAETDDDVQYANRPSGLSLEAFSNLQREVFQDGEGSIVGRAFLDCSICLEKFVEGEELIQLSCRHWFHPECLEPWVKTCGDCPYCRTTI
ncbi:probable E3 ubiquitin-protein ligase RHY1A [Zingiber officinale]|uniref:RING-type domain-containing protein n=1 Tax=Zingiber officinale TaxID=94328 RepID=A0A8J5FII9_ZINOF|nr:probable E3 ubiquitin-protein ligase RHY1A [Zingiber officinale]KAG6490047.1 hypothetical protein ZIOFF_051329 [Zingiber officinale]